MWEDFWDIVIVAGVNNRNDTNNLTQIDVTAKDLKFTLRATFPYSKIAFTKQNLLQPNFKLKL